MTNWKLENKIEKVIEQNTKIKPFTETMVVYDKDLLRDKFVDLIEGLLTLREDNLNHTNAGGDYLTLSEFLNHVIK